MTNKDKQVWDFYTRDVTPVIKKKKLTATAKRPNPEAPRPDATVYAPLPVAKDYTFSFESLLERRREKALREGAVVVEAMLDLHGLTQADAFEALAKFMHFKTKAGKRNLLIVTGKGPAGTGVLRRHVKTWLT